MCLYCAADTEAQSLKDFFLLCHGCHNEVVKIEKERGEKKCSTHNTVEKVLKYVLLLSVGKTPLWICSRQIELFLSIGYV